VNTSLLRRVHPTSQRGQIYVGTLLMSVVIGLLLVIVLWLWPKYRVYSQEMAGRADLKEAEWSKQILIEEV
jgi:hypothetical protein